METLRRMLDYGLSDRSGQFVQLCIAWLLVSVTVPPAFPSVAHERACFGRISSHRKGIVVRVAGFYKVNQPFIRCTLVMERWV
jgi:hypothetical protein